VSWCLLDAAEACSNVGFHDAPPTAQRASAHQAVTTDLASFITVANELRAALVEKGLINGGS
jgi:hypothetical protein